MNVHDASPLPQQQDFGRYGSYRMYDVAESKEHETGNLRKTSGRFEMPRRDIMAWKLAFANYLALPPSVYTPSPLVGRLRAYTPLEVAYVPHSSFVRTYHMIDARLVS